MATEEIDERSTAAADIAALYDSIREKPELFKEIEKTPLHKAAADGKTELVMELMVLQPTMARKLNLDGLSPMHIALKEGHTEIVLSLLDLDKDLVRVKGKGGHTSLHYLLTEGKPGNNARVLTKFLEKSPECIHDVTNRNENALHLAARNSDLEAFQTLIYWLWGSDNSINSIKRILDAKNRDGDTVLHIAASNNQPKILKLATRYSIISLETTNSKNLKALQIAESRNNEECAAILRHAKCRHSFSLPVVFLLQLTGELADKVRSMSNDSSNALLVVATLILTATYQSALSPPGGVYQDNAAASSTKMVFPVHANATSSNDFLFKKSPYAAGSSVLGTGSFLWFFIPNIFAFFLSFVVTCCTLIAVLPGFFSASLVASLSALLFCLMVSAVIIISPNSQCLTFMIEYIYLLFYLLWLIGSIIAVALLIKTVGKKLFYKHYVKANTKNSSSGV